MRTTLFRPSSIARHRARCFHFASPAYHKALLPAVAADREPLRAAALAALKANAAAKLWHDEPVCSLLRGERLEGGTRSETRDAFGAVNGASILASPAELARLAEHVTTFAPPATDLREPVRRAEEALLSAETAGALIANQTIDFGKQDGVTEIEEAIQANPVEQRLNDQLWEAEAAGRITVPRRAVLVPCVSNFSHFLDMSRKTMRSLELGVPVVVLSRTHTAQYPFRWVVALRDALAAEGVDPGYLTFCAADLPGQHVVIKAALEAAASDAALADGPPTPFLFTGARALAAQIKADVCDGVVASTQGPNLMLALGLPPSVAQAAALSATIENSGQCTAMRVLVAPPADASPAAIEALFDGTPSSDTASNYLEAGQFAGLLSPPPLAVDGSAPRQPAGYTPHPTVPHVAYRVRPTLPDAPTTDGSSGGDGNGGGGDGGGGDGGGGNGPFEEHWRQVVVDVVAPPPAADGAPYSEAFLDDVGRWLVKHQPITLSVNGATGDADHAGSPAPPHYAVARRLFEKSALCVYSVGDADVPALTAQARPQDGEVFGELPPLGMMTDVTRFPMVVPSAQAAYYSFYNREHLVKSSERGDVFEHCARGRDGTLGALVAAASDDAVKGYLLELGEYLRTAAVGPRRTHAARTNLYGLQRPPLDGRKTMLRCGETTTMDELLPFVLPFALTNAADALLVSVDPANDALLDEIPRLTLRKGGLEDLELRLHTEKQLAEPTLQATLHRVVRPDVLSSPHPFPLAQQFVTRLLPLGHAKSARADDEHFLTTFEASPKWLRFDPKAA